LNNTSSSSIEFYDAAADEDDEHSDDDDDMDLCQEEKSLTEHVTVDEFLVWIDTRITDFNMTGHVFNFLYHVSRRRYAPTCYNH
jgi:hypothetical protein